MRTSPVNELGVRLSIARKSGDIEEVRRCLNAMIHLNIALRERGFFVYDAVVSNYVFDYEDGLQIQDIGAMTRQGGLERAIDVREKTARNSITSVRLELGAVMSCETADVFENFKREFKATYLVKGAQQRRCERRGLKKRMPENII